MKFTNKLLRISRQEFGEGNGTPSSTLAWKIPWKAEPGRLLSMGLQRLGHNRVISLSLSRNKDLRILFTRY